MPKRDTHTQQRQIRIPDELWVAFAAAAGTQRSELIREFIRWYLRRDGAKRPRQIPKPEDEPPAE